MGISYSDFGLLGIEVHPDVEELSRNGGKALVLQGLPAAEIELLEDPYAVFHNPNGEPVLFPSVMEVEPLTPDMAQHVLQEHGDADSRWPIVVGEPVMPTGYFARYEREEHLVVRPWNVQPLGDGAEGVEIAAAICDASRKRIDDTSFDMYGNLCCLEAEIYQCGEDIGDTIPETFDEMHAAFEEDSFAHLYWTAIFECEKRGLIIISRTEDRFTWTDTPVALNMEIGPMSDYLTEPTALAVWESFHKRARQSFKNALRAIPRSERNTYLFTERYWDPWAS